jgi:hypothetical protein
VGYDDLSLNNPLFILIQFFFFFFFFLSRNYIPNGIDKFFFKYARYNLTCFLNCWRDIIDTS